MEASLDSELAALAATAGTTLVALMTTDAWQQARSVVTDFWKRHRPEAAGAIGADLDEAREAVTASAGGSWPGMVASEWSSRLARAVPADGDPRGALGSLIDQLAALSGGSAGPSSVSITAVTHGNGTANILGSGTQFNFRP
jgi:hypothetical protein